jgi:dynein heavy chain
MLLHSYNSEGGGDKEQNRSEMSLVFFEDCIQHLMRIARILKQPRGNALLVGVGGSGRRSMAKFAAYINEPMDTFQIELKKNYKEKEFQEDIKRLLTSTGYGENEQQFVFSDNQIVSENFLEDINNLLNTGEIPNLFPKEEKDAIIDEIADKAEKAGVKEKTQYYAYFVKQCRAKLHLVLVFSPVGNKFRERARQFPSIINCCTIDWYLPWPEDALYSVASREFQQV